MADSIKDDNRPIGEPQRGPAQITDLSLELVIMILKNLDYAGEPNYKGAPETWSDCVKAYSKTTDMNILEAFNWRERLWWQEWDKSIFNAMRVCRLWNVVVVDILFPTKTNRPWARRSWEVKMAKLNAVESCIDQVIQEARERRARRLAYYKTNCSRDVRKALFVDREKDLKRKWGKLTYRLIVGK